MKTPWNLAKKLAAIGAAFLVLALASIGLTLWVTWNLEGGAAAVNEAGRMRMQTYRLALSLDSGDRAEPARLAAEFDASLALLRTGEPSRPLFVPWSTQSREHFARVTAGWAGLRAAWLGANAHPPTRAEADAFVARVDDFVAAIETQIARSTAILHFVQLVMMVLAIASAVVMLYAGYLFVLEPVARLKRGLEALQQGDLSVRVLAASADEFGELADGFNAMARTLQSAYEDLEEKVREKTLRLERKRQRLADLYEVSAFVAQAPTLEALADGFARRVRRIAHADASSVRWCDEQNRRYVLLAGDDLPPELVSRESCLEAGACHCAPLAGARGSRVIPIAHAGDAPFDHCRRSGFATLVSVPVRLHERTLAEVDLFFRADTALDAEDRELLDTLASHLAGAMESLRAAAMEREAAVAGERSLLARELHDSIAQSLAFMKIQVQLLRQAIQRRDDEAVQRVLGELDTGVRESYADVRELLLHFRTRTSQEDIEPALRATLQKFEHQTGLATHLAFEGHGVPLAPDIQVQVLHILQEALSNVRKHAGARSVELHVRPTPHWRFEVRDDGAGFAPDDPARPETHVGLRIMQERAQRIGARLHIESRSGAGCTVTLELPPATRHVPRTEAALAAA
jgi:two-component system nitrate/nitrite sensor histidine kinase NarX